MSDGELLKRLRDQRLHVWEEAKKLADLAASENRAFTGEEERQWQEQNSDLDVYDKRINEVISREEQTRKTEEAFAEIERRNVERASQVSEGSASAPSPEARKTSTQDELRAFCRGERGRSMTFHAPPDIDYRALTVGTNSAGGYTVPTDFYNRLVQHLIQTSAIMQAGPTVLNTDGGETIQIPKTTAHSTAAIISEGNTVTASAPTFGQVSLKAFKYGLTIQVSRELLEDTGVDLQGYLSMQAGRALGNAIGSDLVIGAGTTAPRGVTIDSTLGVTGAAAVAGVFTSDDLIDLFYSVIPQYRASASCHWIVRDTTVGAIRKLKDKNNRYLWEPSLQVGSPDVFFGKPILVDPFVAAVAAGAKSVVFGDFSQYFVRLASGLRFERSDEFAFDTDLVTFRALLRADGALVDLTGAVKHFLGGASA